MGNIILNAIDTMIVCFAIDEDNDIKERSQQGLGPIIKDMKEYIRAEPVVHYDVEADFVVHPMEGAGLNQNHVVEPDIVVNPVGGVGLNHNNQDGPNTKQTVNKTYGY